MCGRALDLVQWSLGVHGRTLRRLDEESLTAKVRAVRCSVSDNLTRSPNVHFQHLVAGRGVDLECPKIVRKRTIAVQQTAVPDLMSEVRGHYTPNIQPRIEDDLNHLGDH